MDKVSASKRKIISLFSVYIVSVLMLFYAGVLFMQEFIFTPHDVYEAPPPSEKDADRLVYGDDNHSGGTPIVNPTPRPFQDLIDDDKDDEVNNDDTDSSEEDNHNEDSNNAFVEPDEEKYDARYDPEAPLTPNKLYFVDKKVTCELYPVGISADNIMETIRSAYVGGWLEESPYVMPGEAGKCVIAGHNRWKGKAGVFSLLKEMKLGEQVAVGFNKGFARYFEVVDIYEVPYNDSTPMMITGDEPVLVLITCKGDWSRELHTSLTRVVVVCKPI